RDPSEHLRAVLHGLHGKTIGGVAYTAVMPPFGPQLNDAEVAAVVNHERSSWGNGAPLVRAEDVAAVRGEGSSAQAKEATRCTDHGTGHMAALDVVDAALPVRA